jgi:hypothetical protein
MKTSTFLQQLSLTLLFVMGSMAARGQFDDLYHKPTRNTPPPANDFGETNATGDYYDDDQYGYDSDEYDYYDDYDYEYSRRIRRFHRPNPGFGFYDPFFFDPFWNPWYNPFAFGGGVWLGRPMNPWFGPGLNICYNRWNRWGNWGVGWGYSPWGFNSWGNPYMGWGSPWGMDPFMMGYGQGFNDGYFWGWNNGFGNNAWGNQGGGWNWGNPDSNRNPVVYTSRRGGSVTRTPRADVRNPVRDPNTGIEREAQQGNDVRANRQTGDNRNPVRETPAADRMESSTPGAARENGLNPSESGNPQTERPTRRFFQVDPKSQSERNSSPSADPGRNNNERSSDRNMENRTMRQTPRSPDPNMERREAPRSQPRQERTEPRTFERQSSPAPRQRDSGSQSPSSRGSWDSSPRSSGSSGGGFNSGGSGRSSSPASSGGRTSPRG